VDEGSPCPLIQNRENEKADNGRRGMRKAEKPVLKPRLEERGWSSSNNDERKTTSKSLYHNSIPGGVGSREKIPGLRLVKRREKNGEVERTVQNNFAKKGGQSMEQRHKSGKRMAMS